MIIILKTNLCHQDLKIEKFLKIYNLINQNPSKIKTSSKLKVPVPKCIRTRINLLKRIDKFIAMVKLWKDYKKSIIKMSMITAQKTLKQMNRHLIVMKTMIMIT